MKKYIFHFESNPNAIRCLRRIVLTNYNLVEGEHIITKDNRVDFIIPQADVFGFNTLPKVKGWMNFAVRHNAATEVLTYAYLEPDAKPIMLEVENNALFSC